MTSQPPRRVTRSTAIIMICAGSLAAVVAAVLAQAGAPHDRVSRGSVSLAFLAPSGSLDVLTPLIADFRTALESEAVTRAVAAQADRSEGTFGTEYADGSTRVLVQYAAPTAQAADRGLTLGVRTALSQVAAGGVERAEAGVAATKAQFEKLRTEFTAAVRSRESSVEVDLARAAATSAQEDYLDALRHLQEFEAAADSIETGDPIGEVTTGSAGRPGTVVRSAVAAAICGGLAALSAFFATGALHRRRASASGPPRRALLGGSPGGFDSTYWEEPAVDREQAAASSRGPRLPRAGRGRRPGAPQLPPEPVQVPAAERSVAPSQTPTMPRPPQATPSGPVAPAVPTLPGASPARAVARPTERESVTKAPPAFESVVSGANPEGYDFFAAQRELLDHSANDPAGRAASSRSSDVRGG